MRLFVLTPPGQHGARDTSQAAFSLGLLLPVLHPAPESGLHLPQFLLISCLAWMSGSSMRRETVGVYVKVIRAERQDLA